MGVTARSSQILVFQKTPSGTQSEASTSVENTPSSKSSVSTTSETSSLFAKEDTTANDGVMSQLKTAINTLLTLLGVKTMPERYFSDDLRVALKPDVCSTVDKDETIKQINKIMVAGGDGYFNTKKGFNDHLRLLLLRKQLGGAYHLALYKLIARMKNHEISEENIKKKMMKVGFKEDDIDNCFAEMDDTKGKKTKKYDFFENTDEISTKDIKNFKTLNDDLDVNLEIIAAVSSVYGIVCSLRINEISESKELVTKLILAGFDAGDIAKGMHAAGIKPENIDKRMRDANITLVEIIKGMRAIGFCIETIIKIMINARVEVDKKRKRLTLYWSRLLKKGKLLTLHWSRLLKECKLLTLHWSGLLKKGKLLTLHWSRLLKECELLTLHWSGLLKECKLLTLHWSRLLKECKLLTLH